MTAPPGRNSGDVYRNSGDVVHYYNFQGWKYWRCQEVLNRAPLPENEIWRTQKWQDALALKAKKE